MKKRFAIVLALLMALTLAACGDQNDDPNDVVGGDWRVTGVVRDSGSITRDGGDIDVLVCVNADSADFCYDDETYAIYDYVDYPITLQGDPWEEFRSIDFADRNGDGDSDVAMLFELDGQQVLMVWFWDAEAEGFVFQPEESSVEDFGGESVSHVGFEGTWYLDGDETEESVIIIGVVGDWVLYDQQGDTRTAIDSGLLRVVDETQGTMPPIPSSLTASPTSSPRPGTTACTGASPAIMTTTNAWTEGKQGQNTIKQRGLCPRCLLHIQTQSASLLVALSKISTASALGAGVSLVTTTATIRLAMKPGTISNTPVEAVKPVSSQPRSTTKPEITPATAPL